MANQRLVGSCVSKPQNEDYSFQSEYERMPVPTIEEAIKSLSERIPRIESYVSTAKENCYRGSPLLTWDESAAIHFTQCKQYPLFVRYNLLLKKPRSC